MNHSNVFENNENIELIGDNFLQSGKAKETTSTTPGNFSGGSISMEIFKPKFTRKLCRVALPIPPQPLSFYRPQRTQACPGSGDVISVPPNLVIPVLGERCDGCVPFHGYRASFGI